MQPATSRVIHLTGGYLIKESPPTVDDFFGLKIKYLDVLPDVLLEVLPDDFYLETPLVSDSGITWLVNHLVSDSLITWLVIHDESPV